MTTFNFREPGEFGDGATMATDDEIAAFGRRQSARASTETESTMTAISEELSDERLAALIAEARMQCAHPNIHSHYSDGPRVMKALADALEQSLRSGNGGEVRAEYDHDAPPDHSADNAAHFILGALADALKVDFRPAEGSETWEGDVLGTMWHALTDSGVIDEWDGALRVQPKPQTEVKP